MHSFKVHCVLIASIIFWASAYVGIRMALAAYSPGPLALFRFIIASLCIALIYYNQNIKTTILWSHRLQLLLTGVAGIGVYNICLNYGEMTVSAGTASFIVGLMPVFTVFLSIIFLKEQLRFGVWLGIVISLLGLLLLAWGEGAQADLRQGIGLLLISALMGAVLTIVQKRFLTCYHPVAIISWVMWGGTLFLLMFLPGLMHEIKTADSQSTLAVLYMGIFPAALAYLAWGYVLNQYSASKAAITLYALPLVSTLLGFLILNEIPSLLSLLGGGIAVVGALIANRFQNYYSLNSSLAKKVVAVS
ncbi:DMT family transporter [uncultured Legionella sp.]|uniref:DMT family transporter n=1 Tax=uncultured Legionella sp. TaxID=210934 RepID=UPI00260F4354|nr:DMT family transporter [uncultured Legionella sp.]